MKLQENYKKAAIIAFWIILWQIAAFFIHNTIIFCGPVEMFAALAALLPDTTYWFTVFYSFLRICTGFLLAFAIGGMLGGFAYLCPFIRDLLSPIMSLIKSVPVASFIILALIWVGSSNLSVFISFLIVLPIIYINTLAGFENAPNDLLEMAKVFQITPLKKLKYIYWPSIYPYLQSSCKVAIGMGIKSGIAAEVIGVPAHSVGEQLYMSKIYLNTDQLFAWTFTIILISVLFEKAFLQAFKILQPSAKKSL